MQKKRGLCLIVLIILSLSLIGCGGATETPTLSLSKVIEVDSNLTATKVKAGMVYGEDFIMDEAYQMTFVKTVMCSDIHIEGNTVYYTPTDTLEYTPYFMWVCYPQITKDSRATIIAIEDVGGSLKESGIWTVVAVFRKDTDKCLWEFGGTYGTQEAGW